MDVRRPDNVRQLVFADEAHDFDRRLRVVEDGVKDHQVPAPSHEPVADEGKRAFGGDPHFHLLPREIWEMRRTHLLQRLRQREAQQGGHRLKEQRLVTVHGWLSYREKRHPLSEAQTVS